MQTRKKPFSPFDKTIEEEIKFKTVEVGVGTGLFKPDKWLVLHSDDTKSDDITEEFICNQVEEEFVPFCKKYTSI